VGNEEEVQRNGAQRALAGVEAGAQRREHYAGLLLLGLGGGGGKREGRCGRCFSPCERRRRRMRVGEKEVGFVRSRVGGWVNLKEKKIVRRGWGVGGIRETFLSIGRGIRAGRGSNFRSRGTCFGTSLTAMRTHVLSSPVISRVSYYCYILFCALS
jgi:hypothetical protein